MLTVKVIHVVGGPARVLDNDWQVLQAIVEVCEVPYAATGVGETKGAAVWDAVRDLSKQAGTDYQPEIAAAVMQSVLEAVMDASIDVRLLLDDDDIPF